MTLISTSNIETAKKLIKKSKSPIIVEAKDNTFNRKILEYGKFDILLSPEIGGKRDKIKQLDSGLNNITAKIAVKNKIKIGINMKEITKLKKKEKAIKIARIKQNIDICKKAKTKIILLNIKDKKDALNFLTSLGASTQQAKQAVQSIAFYSKFHTLNES